MRSIRRVEAAVVTAAACLIPLFAGCSSKDNQSASSPPPASQPAAPAAPDPAKVHANESGEIPILGFGDVVAGATASGGNVTVAEFKKDLDWLYTHKYCPVSLSDVVSGKVDCPAGTTPIVLAFDGGMPGQYRILSSGNTDPNCAVAILEQMNSDHPDWPLKGVFFIGAQDAIAKKAFGSAETANYKLEHLGADGFDIGCALPANTRSMSADALRKLLANAVPATQGVGRTGESILYVPSGQYPKDIDILKAGSVEMQRAIPIEAPPTRLMHGRPPAPKMTSYAQKYSTAAAVTDGDKPSFSPVSPKFDAYHIPQMKVEAGRSVEALLKSVKDPFISDGDPATIAVPSAKKAAVDAQLVQQDSLQLKTY